MYRSYSRVVTQFTSRALSIVHRPRSVATFIQSSNRSVRPTHTLCNLAVWKPTFNHTEGTIVPDIPWLVLMKMFCWLFNVKNTDLIMTVKKVPKISWLRKFCNFCILHVHMHIMKITQYSCQTYHASVTTLQERIYQLKKVSHFYLTLKKSKFWKWCVFIESEYIFLSQNKKIKCSSVNPTFSCIKWGSQEFITRLF